MHTEAYAALVNLKKFIRESGELRPLELAD